MIETLAWNDDEMKMTQQVKWLVMNDEASIWLESIMTIKNQDIFGRIKEQLNYNYLDWIYLIVKHQEGYPEYLEGCLKWNNNYYPDIIITDGILEDLSDWINYLRFM